MKLVRTALKTVPVFALLATSFASKDIQNMKTVNCIDTSSQFILLNSLCIYLIEMNSECLALQGTSIILRDCAIGPDQSETDEYCNSDLCNDGYLGPSIELQSTSPPSTPSSPSTFTSSSPDFSSSPVFLLSGRCRRNVLRLGSFQETWPIKHIFFFNRGEIGLDLDVRTNINLTLYIWI